MTVKVKKIDSDYLAERLNEYVRGKCVFFYSRTRPSEDIEGISRISYDWSLEGVVLNINKKWDYSESDPDKSPEPQLLFMIDACVYKSNAYIPENILEMRKITTPKKGLGTMYLNQEDGTIYITYYGFGGITAISPRSEERFPAYPPIKDCEKDK